MIMATARQGVRLFTPNDVQTWYQPEGRRIFIGDVLDEKNSDTMSVGFARYAPGQANEWVVTYDEALIVTKGTYTVTAEDGTKTTAKVGEFIFLTKGTKLVYSAEEETEVVYVTYPHWMDAQRKSEHAHLLDIYHPIQGGPPDIRPR
jgi:ethanolamine utilization protein EutQ (cupin superfamily)